MVFFIFDIMINFKNLTIELENDSSEFGSAVQPPNLP